MANRLEAVRLLAEKAGDDLLVEGWVEGPCAESADLRGLSRLMMDFYDDEPFVADLLDFVTAQAIVFAQNQIDAGADIIGIGDAAASLIGPEIYHTWIAPRVRRYVEAIHAAGGLVRLHICGRTQELAPAVAALGVDMIDIDAGNGMAVFREKLGTDGAALAGNLDPVRELRDGDPDSIRCRLEECRRESGDKFIVGAGCEVPRGTPPENLLAMRIYAEETSGKREIE
jgi:MtaA/CmuA family methyltransferase